MSKSYNKNSSLSSPNLNIFSNLLDKSLSFANYLPLPFLKFISLFSPKFDSYAFLKMLFCLDVI